MKIEETGGAFVGEQGEGGGAVVGVGRRRGGRGRR
jgi:hypothetical protein